MAQDWRLQLQTELGKAPWMASAFDLVCLAHQWAAGERGVDSPAGLCPVSGSARAAACRFAADRTRPPKPAAPKDIGLPQAILLLSSIISECSPGQRGAGQYFTPSGIVTLLLHKVGWRPGRGTLLDPACGGGAFLLPALQGFADPDARSRLAFVDRCIFGIEKDPVMASFARLVLAAWVLDGASDGAPDDLWPILRRKVICADALQPGTLQGRMFDFVVGNPPFLGTRRGRIARADARALRGLYSTATGQFDLYAPFVENALSRLAPGGRLALVLPRPFLTNDSAAPLRRLLAERTAVQAIIDLGRPFRAAVETVGLVAQAGTPAGRPSTQFPGLWFRAEHSAERALVERLGLFPTLETAARSWRGLELGKRSSALHPEPPGFPLLRGCDVGRFRVARASRFYRPDPSVPASAEVPPAKILVRRVCSNLAAAMDLEGCFALNTLYLVVPNPSFDPWTLLAVINSGVTNTWFRLAFSFNETLFPYVRLSQLRRLPCCPPEHPLAGDLARLARQRSEADSARSAANLDRQLDGAVAQLFELSGDEKRLIKGL